MSDESVVKIVQNILIAICFIVAISIVGCSIQTDSYLAHGYCERRENQDVTFQWVPCKVVTPEVSK